LHLLHPPVVITIRDWTETVAAVIDVIDDCIARLSTGLSSLVNGLCIQIHAPEVVPTMPKLVEGLNTAVSLLATRVSDRS
jgi:hypothetical protein